MILIYSITLTALLLGFGDAVKDFPQLRHIRTSTEGHVQEEAARGIISRLVGGRAADWDVIVDPTLGPKERDTFRLSSIADGRVLVEGTTGVAVAMGFYHYLKYWCGGQRTWAGQQTELPTPLPVLASPVLITTNDRFRYYKNVCTESYSFAFWQWDKWEAEIDWMALHGINMPLAFTGQEAIFQRVYLQLGFSQEDLDEHFGGPAFLAWSRMGNIRGWGGPLPQMWVTNQLILQHRILKRQRDLGMTPILGAFAGHVPASFTKLFPRANVTKLPYWAGFNETYSRTYLLNFDDPLFTKIGAMFIQETINEFGTDHIYNADTFNEMKPASNSSEYIASAGNAVFRAMVAGDSKAVWLMQGWLFVDQDFWKADQVKALVTSVPIGRMIILDLASDLLPLYSVYESYYGQPFIWCMLHNFGGTNELYGTMDVYNVGPLQARTLINSTMLGIGMTPEGIHQNEVVYEFFSENAWRSSPRDLANWTSQFIDQRYGLHSTSALMAWKRLLSTVYNCSDGHHDNDWVLITQRPSITSSIDIWYRPLDLFLAWEDLLGASRDLEGSELFRYDLVDVSRNSLQVLAYFYYFSIMDSYQANDTKGIQSYGSKMVDLMSDMDTLLNANDRFLVGRWISDATSWATDGGEHDLMNMNARNQITIWGPRGEIIDYAAKQWAGVVGGFYKPRWQFFANFLTETVHNKTRFDSDLYNKEILNKVEIPWTVSTYPYPTQARGNPITISKALYKKYMPVMRTAIFDDVWQHSMKKNHQSNSDSKEAIFQRRAKSLLHRHVRKQKL